VNKIEYKKQDVITHYRPTITLHAAAEYEALGCSGQNADDIHPREIAMTYK